MPALRSSPPLFLLPAWKGSQRHWVRWLHDSLSAANGSRIKAQSQSDRPLDNSSPKAILVRKSKGQGKSLVRLYESSGVQEFKAFSRPLAATLESDLPGSLRPQEIHEALLEEEKAQAAKYSSSRTGDSKLFTGAHKNGSRRSDFYRLDTPHPSLQSDRADVSLDGVANGGRRRQNSQDITLFPPKSSPEGSLYRTCATSDHESRAFEEYNEEGLDVRRKSRGWTSYLSIPDVKSEKITDPIHPQPSLERSENIHSSLLEEVSSKAPKTQNLIEIDSSRRISLDDRNSLVRVEPSKGTTKDAKTRQRYIRSEMVPREKQKGQKGKSVMDGGRRTTSNAQTTSVSEDNIESAEICCKQSIDSSTAIEEKVLQTAENKLSLLEQLFPEEIKKQQTTTNGPRRPEELPRLPPPELDEQHDFLEDAWIEGQLTSKSKTREATFNAFRQENTTVLVLSRVSTALCDADFRRIAPRGTHIEEWRGPGDPLKVIPVRNYSSLSPGSSYYLLFSNPAYARAYQNHAIHLHQLAQTYTPTSLDFPVPPPPGVLDAKGQDIHALLQDFTLSPPSVRMSLRVIFPPFTANLRLVSENQGYPQLTSTNVKAGRAVLFWVDGYQPSRLSLQTMLAKDGQDRGLQWGPLRGEGDIESLHLNVDPEIEDSEENEAAAGHDPYGQNLRKDSHKVDVELKPKRRGKQRFLISFEDEAEARRFTRLWHRRPYPFPLQDENPPYGEPEPLVHAEFLW